MNTLVCPRLETQYWEALYTWLPSVESNCINTDK